MVRGLSDQLSAARRMMAERGVEVDHSSLNRWVLKYTSLLEMVFRQRTQPVGISGQLDETYVIVKDQLICKGRLTAAQQFYSLAG